MHVTRILFSLNNKGINRKEKKKRLILNNREME